MVSDQAGRSNLLARLREIGIEVDPKHPKIGPLLEQVKAREFDGYSSDGAEASFELLMAPGACSSSVPEYFASCRASACSMSGALERARRELVTALRRRRSRSRWAKTGA